MYPCTFCYDLQQLTVV